MRLIPYIRVSTDEQARNGHSIETVHPQRLAAFAALYGHTLAPAIFDKGVSGSVPLNKRPGGKELLRALRAGEADGIVVVSLDRLFRDTLDGLLFFDEFCGRTRRKHRDVLIVDEMIDTSTPIGRLTLTIKLGAAQYERDMGVVRAQDNSRGLRKAGRKYGHAPFGCIAQGGTANEAGKVVDQKLYRDPATWPTRLRIVALRKEGVSLGDIRNWLRTAGIVAPNGGEFWSKNTLAAICELHDELAHLPELPAQVASSPRPAHETGVSHATH